MHGSLSDLISSHPLADPLRQPDHPLAETTSDNDIVLTTGCFLSEEDLARCVCLLNVSCLLPDFHVSIEFATLSCSLLVASSCHILSASFKQQMQPSIPVKAITRASLASQRSGLVPSRTANPVRSARFLGSLSFNFCFCQLMCVKHRKTFLK